MVSALLKQNTLYGNMLITSLKEKELYKVSTPIFYGRNAETDGGKKEMETVKIEVARTVAGKKKTNTVETREAEL